jgi:integrase
MHARLTAPIYAHLEAAAIDAFVGGTPYTQRALAARIAEITGEETHPVARRLPAFLRKLETRGMYESQPSPFGSKSGGPGELTSPHVLNWSGLPSNAPALTTALNAYLADNVIASEKKAAARSAIRLCFDLPTKCPDNILVTACNTLAPDELYGLAERAYQLTVVRGLDRQTAKNHKTTIRALLRYAVRARLIPMVFPRLTHQSPWTERRDQYLPLVSAGRTHARILGFRSVWKELESTAQTLLGEDVQFEDLTRMNAEAIMTHLLLTERQSAIGYKLRQLLIHIADTYREGPFIEPSAANLFTEVTPAGRAPALYLRGKNGEAADSYPDQLFQMLLDLGFDEDLVAFLRWYRSYVTLSPIAILNDSKFPPRRQRHMISDKTFFERMSALRALLGVAVKRLPINADEEADKEYAGLGMCPGDVTADVVFGSKFQCLINEILTWWQARAATLPDGALGKCTSGSLRQIVINLGMFALGYYEYLRHERKLVSARRTSKGGTQLVDARGEESVEKTADEAAAWEAYRFATTMADALTDLTSDGRGRSRKRSNEFRDIRLILEHTPPAWWIALQNGMLEQVRVARSQRRNSGYDYHSLVLNAVTLGLLISTGCRIEELCLVRLDIQFDRKNRIIRLRAIDRKNAKPHNVLLHEAYLPDDLLDEYLNVTRPWFMRNRGVTNIGPATASNSPSTTMSEGEVTSGHRRPGRPKARPNPTAHEFLLVSTSGRPFACLAERPDGSGRDERELKSRAGQLGRRFQSQMAAMARSLKMTLPTRKYEFGPHSVRGACGYGIFLLFDAKAAAQYLGDTIDTALAAYSSIDGSHVDSSGLVGFNVAPSKPAVAVATPITSDYAGELKELTSDFKQGLITREEFDRAKASLHARFAAAA